MKLLKIFFIFLCIPWAIAQTPMLTGTVEISIKNGTLDCDLTLSDIPKLENYEILLNTGLNIDYILDTKNNNLLAYNRKYSDTISYESFMYSFPNGDNNGKFIPKTLNFKYTGKFPIKSDKNFLSRSSDWKGNIAFNGKTLRMDGNQSNWYPTLLDLATNKRYNEVKYDINIKCSDCKTLYVNGNDPKYSNKERFSYDYPTDLLLFVGDYEFKRIKNIYFLNDTTDNESLKDFVSWMQKIKMFYAEKIGIPYDGNFNFIQTTPTFTKDSGFMFVSFPSIVNVSYEKYNLKQLISYPYMKPILAHELGHYYFGSGYKTFNSVIGNATQEAFAEFLSTKATLFSLGKEAYQEKLKTITAPMQKNKHIIYPPIATIKSHADFKDYQKYAYNYFPTILLAIERELGEDLMYLWIQKLLTTNSDLTDHSFLTLSLKSSIKNPNKYNKIVNTYLNSDKALENALQKLKL